MVAEGFKFSIGQVEAEESVFTLDVFMLFPKKLIFKAMMGVGSRK